MEQTMPDVVLMDIQMPGVNGIEAVQMSKKISWGAGNDANRI